MLITRKQLERDLARWRTAGWVTPEGADAIGRELEAGRGRPALAAVLATLGAVLLGFAAMTFVAANWAAMPKLARFLLLMGFMWGAYGLAAWLLMRKLEAFAHAAILAGVAVFGASIMLIAQMYHIDGDPPGAVLLWAAGALLAGLAFPSGSALAFAMVLTVVWSGWETALREGPHWAFLPAWAAVAAAFFWLKWRPGLHLSAVALTAWIVTLGYVLPKGPHHGLIAGIGVVIALGAAFAQSAPERIARLAPTTFSYGVGVGFAGLFAAQFFTTAKGLDLALLAILTLGLLLGAIYWAAHTQNRSAAWLGYAGFSVEILALYFETLGTLIDTSLFYLLTGLIVVALSVLAYRLQNAGLLGTGARS